MKKTQKILSAALSAALVLSAMAVPAFADGEAGTIPTTTETGGATTGGTTEGGTTTGGTTEGEGTTTGESTTTNVANVDGVECATVEAVNNAIKNSESKTVEIKLLDNATESINIPSGVTVTLDLNGNKIKVTAGDAIVNKGTLTVKDDGGDGEVSTSASESAAVANFPDASATLNGGTYISANWYVIKNLGTMVIDGKVSVKKPDKSTDTSSLVDNGWGDKIDTVAGERLIRLH